MTANEALRKSRLDAGLTIAALAAKMGITNQYLSDLELGRRNISDDLAFKLPEPMGRAVRAVLAEQYRKKAREMER